MSDVFQEAKPLSAEDRLLADLYLQTGRPLDDLPYTEDFDQLFAKFSASYPRRTKREVVQRLLNLRKAACLPRLGRQAIAHAKVAPDDSEILSHLVTAYAGSLGRRDQLPYTEEFEKLARDFNRRRVENPLDHHAIWRLIATITKST